MAYVSCANTDVAAYEDLPDHHLLAARNLIATANDESYHGSASELPPATSHGYVEWDFSGVPDPVMFQRFLDGVDYWFGYSDDSSAGSYDPARECFVVVVDDQANDANASGAGDGEAPQHLRTGLLQVSGPSAPPPHRQGAPTSTRSWPQRATRGQACGGVTRGATASCLHRWRSLRARRTRARAGRQAHDRINADFDVNNPNTPPRVSQKLIASATLL
jgi:hypothetical protein